MVTMRDMIKMAIAPSTGWGRLTCLYKSHQMLPLLRAPFQRKTPEIMRASRTNSLMNVEKIQTLGFEI